MDATTIHQFVINRTGSQTFGQSGNQTTLLEEYDPYIAGLIRKLQNEVRDERIHRRWRYQNSIR